MTKVTYISEVHSNQSINYLIVEEKQHELKIFKYPKAFIDYSQTVDELKFRRLQSIKEKESVISV